MRKFLVLVFTTLLLATATGVDSYAQLSNLHFTGYRINKISPKSFRSCYGDASVSVRNDSLAFTMSNIQGVVYKKGKAFVSGKAADMTVPVGNSTVSVTGLATLCEGVSFWEVLSCIAFHASDYTIDVEMDIVNSKGTTRHFKKEQMSVAAVLNNVRGKKSK